MKGFTLTEVMVVIALLLICMVFGLAIFWNNNVFYENQTGKIRLVNATREAADRIEEYGREAISISSTYVYSGTTYTSGSTTIVFLLPGRDASGNILSSVNDRAIITTDISTPTKLRLIVDSDPASARPERDVLLTDQLTNFTINYDVASPASSGTATFQITTTASGRRPAIETVYGRVTMRN